MPWLSGQPYCRDSSLALNVDSSKNIEIFFAVRSGGGEPMSTEKASLASSLVAKSLTKKHRLLFDGEILSVLDYFTLLCPSMYTPFFCPLQGIQVHVAMLVQFVRSHFLGILGQEYYWV